MQKQGKSIAISKLELLRQLMEMEIITAKEAVELLDLNLTVNQILALQELKKTGLGKELE